MQMRVRDEQLRSGRLLGWFDPEVRQYNSALLFLARGVDDIEPLTRTEQACQQIIEARGLSGFEWHQVADVGHLASVDPSLVPSRVTRIEAAELAMLSVEELEGLLEPALVRLAAGEAQLFPVAGATVGSPAEGIQFLGREQEIRSAIDLLEKGHSLEILAPRRSGKSSLLRRLEKSLPQGWSGVFVNLEREFTAEDLAARLWVLATGDPYRAAQRQAEDGWESLLVAAVERLLVGSEALILLLDELVSFFQNQTSEEEEGSRAALAMLETLGRVCEGSPVRLVVANSLPLGEYLHEILGLRPERLPKLFRSLEALRLITLDLPEPHLELRRVLLGTGLVPEVIDLEWLYEHMDLALPYPALRFLDFLASHLRARGSAGKEELARLLEEFLETTDAFEEFESNLRRRGQQQPGGLKALRSCLDRLATAEPGAKLPRVDVEKCLEDVERPGELFAWLLEAFPVVEREKNVILVSRLFRRWWRRQIEDGKVEP